MSKEKEKEAPVQILLRHILDSSVEDTGDSGDGGCCPYCKVGCSWRDELNELTHDTDCIYLIAKELIKII